MKPETEIKQVNNSKTVTIEVPVYEPVPYDDIDGWLDKIKDSLMDVANKMNLDAALISFTIADDKSSGVGFAMSGKASSNMSHNVSLITSLQKRIIPVEQKSDPLSGLMEQLGKSLNS
jgi:hypothetical protein